MDSVGRLGRRVGREVICSHLTTAQQKCGLRLSLINQLSGDFDITGYHDTYTERLLKLIEAKAKGVKTPTPKMKIVKSSADDLMAQLKASLGKKSA